MESIDRAVLLWLNGLAGRAPAADAFLVLLAFNPLLKGGVLAAGLFAVWFGRADPAETRRRRSVAMAALLAVGLALALNRVLASLLPFRPRPLQDATLALRALPGIRSTMFSDLSSFPSDHAVLFVGLPAGLFAASKAVGAALLAHGIIAVLLVRLYVGLHYPSDMLAGAALGGAAVLVALRRPLRDAVARPFLAWSERHPGSFYPLFFLLGLEVATLFDEVVKIAVFARELAGSR